MSLSAWEVQIRFATLTAAFMMAALSENIMTIAISLPLRRMKSLAGAILLFSLLMGTPVLGTAQSRPSVDSTGQGLKPILDYISTAWDTLTRSMTDCKSIVDPKITAQSVLYLPKEMAAPASVKTLVGNCNVRSQQLPEQIQKLGQISTSNIDPPGLLYLPNKYVVPGGRFNEMYGWDSYFIVRGLLQSGRIDIARGMVDNFFFEIEHYGAMLNANRTYYLTRSQPPFLSSMFVEVYEASHPHAAQKDDKAWLERA